MSKQEWQELVRNSKNENDYHKLTICIRGYIKERMKGGTVVDFYLQFTSEKIKYWYKQDDVFRYFRYILNK